MVKTESVFIVRVACRCWSWSVCTRIWTIWQFDNLTIYSDSNIYILQGSDRIDSERGKNEVIRTESWSWVGWSSPKFKSRKADIRIRPIFHWFCHAGCKKLLYLSDVIGVSESSRMRRFPCALIYWNEVHTYNTIHYFTLWRRRGSYFYNNKIQRSYKRF